jgi:hypothetical protein
MENPEITFANGFIFKRNEQAPDWAIGKVSIKVSEFKAFLDEHADGDWLNLEVKKSKSGKYYAQLDTWKPEKKAFENGTPQTAGDTKPAAEATDDLPF